MKYVYVVVKKAFYKDYNHVDRMVADCYNEPEVFSSYTLARASLEKSAKFYTKNGWAGEWHEIHDTEIGVRNVLFTQQAETPGRDGKVLFYIIKAELDYFSYLA